MAFGIAAVVLAYFPRLLEGQLLERLFLAPISRPLFGWTDLAAGWLDLAPMNVLLVAGLLIYLASAFLPARNRQAQPRTG
jgi:ACR3 family arsenite efflux pump ArsB